jgi:hypothetical protein
MLLLKFILLHRDIKVATVDMKRGMISNYKAIVMFLEMES